MVANSIQSTKHLIPFLFRYIAALSKEEIENGKAKEDWKFVAMVLDRLFLWIFSAAVVGKETDLSGNELMQTMLLSGKQELTFKLEIFISLIRKLLTLIRNCEDKSLLLQFQT